MKKKLTLLFTAITAIVLCLVCLIACNNDNTPDKANANADFVAYRKKVVAILKDNGIFVNDLDSPAAKNSAKSSVNVAFAADGQAASDNISDFASVMQKPEYLADSSNYDFALKQVFGMSLKMSLCLGDGISNYFDETAFFNIPVSLSGMYLAVSEQGDVNTVRSYSPSNSDGGFDTYEKIDLDFKSATDYSFKVVSANNGTMYASGNAQKQFIMIGGHEVVYSPNGTTFYETDDEDVVAQCYAILGESALTINKSEFTALKSNVRYTFTDAQVSALTDKYFKDIQSSTAERQGLQFTTAKGVRYADSYIAINNETEIEIPTGTEYISDNFTIYDKSGTVKSLYIPKSVKGVVQLQDPKTGQEYSTPKIITSGLNMDTFRLDLVYQPNENAEPTPKVFSRVSVENSSPLFASGTGHLKSKDGEYLCVADVTLAALDEKLFDYSVTASIEEGFRHGYYGRLFDNVTELDFDINEQSEDSSRFYEIFMSRFNNLTHVSLHGEINENTNTDFNFYASKDLSVDVEYANTWLTNFRGGRLLFASADGKSHNVTVNLKGLSTVNEIIADGVKATLNIEAAEVLYDSCRIPKPDTDGDVTVRFADGSLTDAQKTYLYNPHTRSGNTELSARFIYEKGSQSTVEIPASIGMPVTQVELFDEGNVTEVKFGSNIKYIVFDTENSHLSYNIKYDGSIADFEQIQIICYASSYSFNVVCNDGTRQYSGERQIPDYERCTITVTYPAPEGGKNSIVIVWAKGRSLDEIRQEQIVCVPYFLVDSDGVIFGEISNSGDGDIHNFSVIIGGAKIKGDLVLEAVEANTDPQDVEIIADGLTLRGTFDGYGFLNISELSISFSNGYVYNDNYGYIDLSSGEGIYEMGYNSEVVEITLSLRFKNGKHVITLTSYTRTKNPTPDDPEKK